MTQFIVQCMNGLGLLTIKTYLCSIMFLNLAFCDSHDCINTSWQEGVLLYQQSGVSLDLRYYEARASKTRSRRYWQSHLNDYKVSGKCLD